MRPSPLLVISDLLTLRSLQNNPKKRHIKKIELNLAIKDVNKMIDLEKRINKHYFECGCESGAKITIAATRFLIPLSIGAFIYFASILYALLFLTSGVIIAAIGGKIAGKIKGRVQLKQDILEIESLL